MSRVVGLSTVIELGLKATPIDYTPEAIDEYLVLVNLPEDWEEVHNYIINENEIDGIPNRRVDCTNEKKFSLRGAIYAMSVEEAELLATHAKVESVTLNPDKYPQPESLLVNRFKKDVAINKPLMTADLDLETIFYYDKTHSNWSMSFMENPGRFPAPYSGVGIASTTVTRTDLKYSYTGKGVDAVVIDTGTGTLHPELVSDEGVYRNRDVILDGPYYVDPEYFNSNGYTYTRVLGGHTLGVGIATDKAKEWWTDASKRSAKFQSLGTISSSISATYTYGHATASSAHTDDSMPIGNSHGTSCSAQIGGKSFGLAKNANMWSIRVNLGDGAPIGAATALDFCTLWHQAKKKAQAGDVNPTIINNSWGSGGSTGNSFGVTYNIHYRGTNSTYTGNGSQFNPPAGSDGFRQHAQFTFRRKTDTTTQAAAYSANGDFNTVFATTNNSAAENAIAAGCIVVAAVGNDNGKLCDRHDVDFNNWFQFSNNFVHRCGGVDKGFSGDHDIGKGTIRIGALDCAVEPDQDLQGAGAYKMRKVCYSTSGPMVDIFAPGEMTMSASYKSVYNANDFARPDANDGTAAGTFYDRYFNGTSAATPNAVGLMCLYLESNRKASQQDVRNWLTTEACKDGLISDPYPGINDTGYWSQARDDTFDGSNKAYDSRNVRGNGSLRGAPNRVAFNPYATNKTPKFSGVKTNGIRFQQS